MYLDEKELEEFDMLAESFEDMEIGVNFDDGRRIEFDVSCFDFLKKIIYGHMNKDELTQQEIAKMREQLTYAKELLIGIGITNVSIFEKLQAILE